MDARRELSLIRKQFRNFSRNYGESIVYFEYKPATSPASAGGSWYDDVYDEGRPGTGGRSYAPGIVVPVLKIQETEDQKRAIPEGRQPVQVVNVVASVEDLRVAGVSNPYEYQRHLNDMFLYDGRYYGISMYRVKGRAKDDVLVLLDGYEMYISEEMSNDPGPAALGVQNLPWPSTLADL